MGPIVIDDDDDDDLLHTPLLRRSRRHSSSGTKQQLQPHDQQEDEVRDLSRQEFDAAVQSSRRQSRRRHSIDSKSKATPSAHPKSDGKREEDQQAEDANGVFEMKPPPPEAEGYHDWCFFTLSRDFPRVSALSLRRALKHHMKRLGPCYIALRREYTKALEQERVGGADTDGGDGDNSSSWLPVKLNKSSRKSFQPSQPCPLFDREFEIVKRRIATEEKHECGCCFCESSFEELAQCLDGHLFCFSCLRRHVEEATFGGGGRDHTNLPCMDTAGCSEYFPASEVARALPADVLSKYESRMAEESVARARLEGLVYCPFCNFPCEVDPGLRELDCPNTSCAKGSCLKCKEPSHLPLKCHQVEKKSETSVRRQVEELMTKALVRECPSCKAELVKQDGCNKVTCRCGQTMCYVCRQKIAHNYTHFCQHARAPGKPCTSCKRCDLYSTESSDAVVKAAKAAAMQAAAVDQPDILNREIGPQDNIRKRRR